MVAFGSDVKELFVEHNIDGEVLPHLTEELLVEMGIGDTALRTKLLTAIKFEVNKTALKDSRRPNKSSLPSGTRSPATPDKSGLVSLYSETSSAEGMEQLYAYADRYGFLDDERFASVVAESFSGAQTKKKKKN